MKAGDAQKRDTLRYLDSMVKNVEIEKKKKEEGLSDEEVQEVIARAVKQRKGADKSSSNGCIVVLVAIGILWYPLMG